MLVNTALVIATNSMYLATDYRLKILLLIIKARICLYSTHCQSI
ncbi:hypothetical protein A1OE_421 [Candidatus Endolissoclinum faulkneri L2]|uniref:Uncharacterized protein n=1 Tax=Candidatus Endolissoclinum faulkneri L2 TaxID=1193729 RepID=K7YPW2_9PROT|nr:hypothetical protein A1OE_421 [Candidatus Endolissoclinum faulkneri L2]